MSTNGIHDEAKHGPVSAMQPFLFQLRKSLILMRLLMRLLVFCFWVRFIDRGRCQLSLHAQVACLA